ncbi:MAG: UbiA family prenyltransferase [Verrucomicrobia bacterium]|nr:UbiA family prenyltransferase [Verrucomicrobiota bacterium]
MRPKRDSTYGCIKALLLLGRVSNLPTVWSNCLAAWLLAGGALAETADLQRFGWLIAGSTLLYLAGMFLNDAFDEKFDREHRMERPIPSSVISARFVWMLGIAQMALGLACVVWINVSAALCALALAGAILWYNRQHKRIAWSPIIMGLCRLLLYLLAGVVAVGAVNAPLGLASLALCGYVIGLSNIARKEATRGRVNSWPCWLLALPLAVPFVLNPVSPETAVQDIRDWLPLLFVYALWVGRSLLFTFKAAIPQHGRTVSGLLAGMVLFDALMASVPNPAFGLLFMGLFFLSLLLQRYIPAT